MSITLTEKVIIVLIIFMLGYVVAAESRIGTYTITFYSTGEEGGNGKWGDLNAMGGTLRYGDIACDPAIPFGTEFIIDYEGLQLPKPENGTFVCRDRGSAIKGNKIDIFIPKWMGGVERCFRLGKLQMKVRRK
jgi:3D (Asp-Asp-Asp) domain-containing protein